MSGIAALLQAAKYIDKCEVITSKKWHDLPDEVELNPVDDKDGEENTSRQKCDGLKQHFLSILDSKLFV